MKFYSEEKGLKEIYKSGFHLICGPIVWVPWITLIFIWLSTDSIIAQRGPHHPRSPVVHSIEDDHKHHYHYVPQRTDGEQIKLTSDNRLIQDQEHLKEDLGEWFSGENKEMSQQELEFHYFKVHDFDNDSKLDGLEMLKALFHILPMMEGPTSEEVVKENEQELSAERVELEKNRQREQNFNYYVELIDKVLEEDDLDHDGYLSYPEYVAGRRKEDNSVSRTLQ